MSLGASPQSEQISAGKAGSQESFALAQPPAISLPKGGGAIRGIGEKFASNPVTGTGSMSVPIATTPGRAGFGPELSLSYNSASSNGPFSSGWHLSMPAITRKTDKGLPRYYDAKESDVFILSGAEDLVPQYKKDAAGNWLLQNGKHVLFEEPRTIAGKTYIIRRYQPRVEGLFARIERWTNGAVPGDVFWRSISHDNITTWYGRTANSRIADPADPSRIFSWLICESYDDKGNVIVYDYKEEDSLNVDHAKANERNRTGTANRYLKHIYYGNHTPYYPVLDSSVPWPKPPAFCGWHFQVVFDYGEHDSAHPRPDDAGSWPVRNDPFSSYRSGFEVRTYRLCRRVLMFHHFPAEAGVGDNCLVRSTDFTYRHETDQHDPDNPIFSFLLSVTQTGYKRQKDNDYLSKSLPPLEFEYSRLLTEAELNQQPVEYISAENLENLPVGLGSGYRWVDLDGEGISGILTEQAGAWFYKPNLGHGRFGPNQTVTTRPSLAALNDGRQQLLDLAADGQLDLVDFSDATPGFYERTHDAQWAPHRAFDSLPLLDWSNPNLRFIDLTGDGHADLLITENDTFTWHRSLAEAGFDEAQRLQQSSDEEHGPHLIFADDTQSIYLTDMSGDGLIDLARIRNGEIAYWPNLGYGRFGAKVIMDHAPWFDLPELFDPRRFRLSDIDGSGTTDILYLGQNCIDIYRNQSGNSWASPMRLAYFPSVDNLTDISVIDLTGNGTACLVWSSPLSADAAQPMRYIDLMAGRKPHLLVGVKNNLGAETHVDYAPSTRFYLADAAAGRPWITKLPFPVHVVERVVTYDHISRNRFVTRYDYHHGYYDRRDREFRGFARVDQRDTEEFAALETNGLLQDADNLDKASHVPPVLTKTWFHTGAYIGRDHISDFFAGTGHGDGEYYREPALRGENGQDSAAQALLLPDTVLPAGLMAAEAHEACRALKGSLLRQEIYALDGSTDEKHPYTVTEQNFTIKQLQPQDHNRHSVFFTHARETLNYHYERCPADPRISHALTLEVDHYGNVIKEVAIAYGRRPTIQTIDEWGNFKEIPNPGLSQLDPDDQKKQTQRLITYTENRVTNAVETYDNHRSPLPCETRTYELTGIYSRNNATRFCFAEWTQDNFALLSAAEQIPYEETAGHTKPQKRPIEHLRILYRPNDFGASQNNPLALLPLGSVGAQALPGETYRLAFTPGLLQQLFQRPLDLLQPPDTSEPECLLPNPAEILSVDPVHGEAAGRGGYVDLDGDGHWWIPSGRVFYSPQNDDSPLHELAHARQRFFLPHRYRDPFHTLQAGTEILVSYDPYNLLVTQTIDPLDNTMEARNDYRFLQPYLVTDPNRNQSEVAFDVLGMVTGTAVMGKAGENLGDSLAGFAPDLTQDQIDAFYDVEDPHVPASDLLKDATTRIIYDLHRFRKTQQEHPHEREKWQPVFASVLARETHANDALPAGGLKIQINFTYSDGFGREIQQKIQAEPGPLVEGGEVIDQRWVGSGWTIYNNRGKPVRQFESFYSQLADKRHQYEFNAVVGVSPIIIYDPLERVIATLHPNHTFEKVTFDAWQQSTYDANDTVAPRGQETADPRTDPHISGFVYEYFKNQSTNWQTWYQQRLHHPHGHPQRETALKAAAHAGTPTVAHFDSLCRPFLTVSHNRVDCRGHNLHSTEERIHTRVELDIEGNQREVIDAKGRVIMRYHYNMAGPEEDDEDSTNLIHQASMEAGEHWLLKDLAGNPVCTWDSRSFVRQMTYDQLRRPSGLYVTENGFQRLAEMTVYGESQGDAANHRTRLYQVFDGAGIVTSVAYDFKGNLLQSRRDLLLDYKQAVNWLLNPSAIDGSYTSHTTYDALNRPRAVTSPDATVYRPTYNEANLLDKVNINLHGSEAATLFVANIDYDAKGRRQQIVYGNGAATTYEYDPLTLRLTRLKSTRPDKHDGTATHLFDNPELIQDLHYTYDPVGNITHIEDSAHKHVYHNNQPVEPINRYTYDALYRLILASGREHLAQKTFDLNPPKGNRRNYPFVGYRAHPNDLHALRRNTEQYEYDAVGNIMEICHTGWTRRYAYEENSLLEPCQKSNRLSRSVVGNDKPDVYTHDLHGNITAMPHLPRMVWDYENQLQQVDLGGGGKAFYVYDADGQRIRKIIERKNGTKKEERVYLGDFEIYRKFRGNGATLKLQRETLHVRDDQQRIALVETKAYDTKLPANATPQPLIRYQLANHLGSASVELDFEGSLISYEEYHPYGTTAFQAGRSAAEVSLKRYRHTGKERDEETGFSYHIARYYAPWIGRWITADPDGLTDGSNLYAYTKGNPILFVDLSGTRTYLPPNPHRGQHNLLGWAKYFWAKVMLEFNIGGKLSGRSYTPSWKRGGVGGLVGGPIRVLSFRTIPAERDPTILSRGGMEIGASAVPILNPSQRLVTGTTVSGLSSNRAIAGVELLLQSAPIIVPRLLPITSGSSARPTMMMTSSTASPPSLRMTSSTASPSSLRMTSSTGSRRTIESFANQVRFLRKSRKGAGGTFRPRTVAHLRVRRENEYLGYSGWRKKPGQLGFRGLRGAHPLLERLNPNLGRHPLECAEVHALNQALWEMGENVSLSTARTALQGSTIRTGQVYSVRSGQSALHGQPHTPCDTCRTLLDVFGISYLK